MQLELKQQAIKLVEEVMKAYYCRRDIYLTLSLMAPEVTWIGPGEREKVYTLEGIREYFERGKDNIPICEVSNPDLRATDLGEDYCMVTGSMTINTTLDSQLIVEVDQRVSFALHFHQGAFEIVHLHISNPYGEMQEDEYFPYKAGAQSYRYLQHLLSEKIEVIDMIAGNINGGLKGSVDDNYYTYFYVNDGLPQMLGLTYEEFMEKSGGTAVGAVYPPDLAGALEDCARCFAEGNDYASEYRMEKKDGSLMWVLDSGRKMVDSNGETRINSIITDITPLKQAQFELEIERERYRIALEHMTGGMCEYDILKDVFTLYHQTENHHREKMKQIEIPHFSKEILTGKLMGIEDGEKLLAICTKQSNDTLTFRTCLPDPNGRWYWMQLSCSIICDHGGTPVRAIGILQDITMEKQKNMELLTQIERDGLTGILNQTAIKEAIQTLLATQPIHSVQQPAMLMIDLDHFKSVNDLNGHLFGDYVLIETAKILAGVFDESSLIGRVGGDEFLVLLRDANRTSAEILATQVIEQIRALGQACDFPISCSIGIAYRQQSEKEFIALFERADRALYHAKNSGRDRFYID